MNWIKLDVIFCSMILIRCRLRFKMKETTKRNFTILSCKPSLEKTFNNALRMRTTVNTFLKDETQLNLHLVTVSPYIHVKVDNLQSVDTFLGHLQDSNYDDCADLKEFLQLFGDGNPQTLVFIGRHIENDIAELFYRLQEEKNVDVIFVSVYTNIFNLKQFPRHLKFSLFTDIYHDQLSMQLKDVIANPNFNRFEFEKHLPGFKDRSCLTNLQIIPVISSQQFMVDVMYSNFVRKAVESIKYYSQHILNVHPLLDKKLGYSPRPIPKHYILDFGKTSYAKLRESAVLDGAEPKVFLFLYNMRSRRRADMEKMENMIKASNQNKETAGLVKVFVQTFYWSVSHGGSVTHEYDIEKRKGLDIIMDLLVDVGCQ